MSVNPLPMPFIGVTSNRGEPQFSLTLHEVLKDFVTQVFDDVSPDHELVSVLKSRDECHT